MTPPPLPPLCTVPAVEANSRFCHSEVFLPSSSDRDRPAAAEAGLVGRDKRSMSASSEESAESWSHVTAEDDVPEETSSFIQLSDGSVAAAHHRPAPLPVVQARKPQAPPTATTLRSTPSAHWLQHPAEFLIPLIQPAAPGFTAAGNRSNQRSENPSVQKIRSPNRSVLTQGLVLSQPTRT